MQNRLLPNSEGNDVQSTIQKEEAPILLKSTLRVVDIDETPSVDEKQLLKDIYEKYLRLNAEFENYKKRAAREMESLTKFSNEVLITEILPFIDNLERAMKYGSLKKNDTAWAFMSGVQLAIFDLMGVLKKHGLKPIDATGQVFVPSFHDAVSAVKTVSHPPNTVIEELRKGYLLNDRLLRPSRVVVALAPDPEFDDEPESA